MVKICEFFKTDLTSACTSFAGTTASAFALGKLGVHVVAFQSAAIVSGVTATVQLLGNKCFGKGLVVEGLSLVGGLTLGAVAQRAVAEKLGEVLDAKGLAFIAVAMIAFKAISIAVPALFKSVSNVKNEDSPKNKGSDLPPTNPSNGTEPPVQPHVDGDSTGS